MAKFRMLSATGVQMVLLRLPPAREGHRAENGATRVRTTACPVAMAAGAPVVLLIVVVIVDAALMDHASCLSAGAAPLVRELAVRAVSGMESALIVQCVAPSGAGAARPLPIATRECFQKGSTKPYVQSFNQ